MSADHPTGRWVSGEFVYDAVNCCNPDHWFDSRVGWPGKHDGGLPEFPRTPCEPFE